jgi:hypothetical protein
LSTLSTLKKGQHWKLSRTFFIDVVELWKQSCLLFVICGFVLKRSKIEFWWKSMQNIFIYLMKFPTRVILSLGSMFNWILSRLVCSKCENEVLSLSVFCAFLVCLAFYKFLNYDLRLFRVKTTYFILFSHSSLSKDSLHLT